MRTTKSVRVGWTVAGFALALAAAGVARADISTERPGSILIFPKVIADGTRDTIIQITNTRSMLVHARCFYVDGSTDINTRQPRWQESDFAIWLTRQQPTHWQVSLGRSINPLDNAPGSTNFPLGAGLDPGQVPPVTSGFTGYLLCAEVDSGDVPMANNALKGEATVRNSLTGDVTKYNALAIQGIDPDTDPDQNGLSLDNAEYNGCPAALRYNLIGEGLADPVVEDLGEAGSVVRNFVTLIPCESDFENLVPETVPIELIVFDEFEQRVSRTGISVTCWERQALGLPPFVGVVDDPLLGGIYRTVNLRALTQGGLLGVYDNVVTDGVGNSASAAGNFHLLGNTTDTNLPNDAGTPGSPAVIRLSVP
jgi:hypothetical protein